MGLLNTLGELLTSDYDKVGSIGAFEVEEKRDGLYNITFYNVDVYVHKETEELKCKQRCRVYTHTTTEEKWKDVKSLGGGSPWRWRYPEGFDADEVKTYRYELLPDVLEEDL